MPLDPQQAMQEAMAARQSGDLARADAIGEALLTRNPNFLPAKMLRAVVATDRGEHEKAIGLFQDLIVQDPSFQPAYRFLGALLRYVGRVNDALAAAERAAQLMPRDGEALTTLGLCLFDLERFADAAKVFRQAVKLDPVNASVLSHLASALDRSGRVLAAAEASRRAAELNPNAAEFRRLAKLELRLGNAAEAAECLAWVVDAEPGQCSNRVAHAQALRSALEFGRAEEQLKIALDIEPGSEAVRTESGFLLQSQGRFADAEKVFEDLIRDGMGVGVAYYGIFSGRRAKTTDVDSIGKMRALLSAGGLSTEDELHLEYALGKVFDDLSRYPEAIQSFDTANSVAKATTMTLPFVESEFVREIDEKIALFDAPFFERNRQAGSDTDLPLFVVGMMRSGTTLTEQLLTRHSEIGGVGEQAMWAIAQPELIDSRFGTLSADKLRATSAKYLARLMGVAPGKRYVIDKNPANVLALGLIHAAYPKAKFIHVKRHPVDTALSIWMTKVQTPPPFGCDRSHIVFAYEQYLRMFEHWRTVVPKDLILDIEYENIIQSPEETMREVLNFLGLEWDDACLHPELNNKGVNTPSFWQVRQPLFNRSVGKWKNYEPYLGEFQRLMPA